MPFDLDIVDGIIIQVQLSSLIALGGMRITVPSRILDLLELGMMFHSQGDKQGVTVSFARRMNNATTLPSSTW